MTYLHVGSRVPVLFMRINDGKEDCVSMQDIGCGGPQSEMRISLQQSAEGNTILVMHMLHF